MKGFINQYNNKTHINIVLETFITPDVTRLLRVLYLELVLRDEKDAIVFNKTLRLTPMLEIFYLELIQFTSDAILSIPMDGLEHLKIREFGMTWHQKPGVRLLYSLLLIIIKLNVIVLKIY